MNGTPFELAFTAQIGAYALRVEHAWTARVSGIFGPSGSGKSTLLEVLLGFRPRATLTGRALVGGAELFDGASGRFVPPERRGLGWVPQDAQLFPHLSVRENVGFAAKRGHPVDAERLGRVAALCEIDGLLARRPADLSGGERQRTALARALYGARRVLLLDEPFASLDLKRRRRLLAALRAHAQAESLALVYVSHDWGEVEALCEHVLLLEAGRLVAAGAPHALTPY